MSTDTTPPPAPTRAAARAYLDELSAEIAAARRARPALPSVLISGTMRCGKTRVARALVARTGHVIVETDQIRNALYRGCSETERRRLMKYAYRSLLLRWPQGIVIEGTALMDAPCELPLWAARRGLHVATIGYSEGSVEAKTRDLLAFRATHNCWTRKAMDDAGVKRLARQIRNRSKDLQRWCAAHGLPYHHLDSGQFHAECNRIADEIEAALRAEGIPDAQPGLAARLQFWKRR